MEGLPPDIERSLFKAIGAYLRATPTNELPARVRPFAGFTEAAMSRHKKEVLSLLDDEAMRALIDEWVREDKPKLAKTDAANLAVALKRDDGWLEELQGRARGAPKSNGDEERSEKLAQGLEREKVKAKKAKEDLQKVRAEYETVLKSEKARSTKLEAELDAMRSRLTSVEAHLVDVRRDASAAAERAEREVRRARKDADKAVDERDKLRLQVKDARKELRGARSKIASLEGKDAPAKKAAPKKKGLPQAPRERGPRAALVVPKGRFEDAPETLGEWLRPGVTLIVDGYNVTKAERGFGELELEVQRDRLIEETEKLARRKKVQGTIVFDGSEVPPGTSRRRKGTVRVEFSAPDEIADDHIVALIEAMPPDPVVLVTNDRELQERARSLGATIARSDQLLSLIKP